MASAAQILANKANAQHSTGPRTEAGKAASAKNATTHGFSSKTIVIPRGQEEEFTRLEATLRQQFAPDAGFQELLFHRILHAAWNQHRCDLAEVELQQESAAASRDPLLVQEFEHRLRLLATYATRAERSFLKYVKELRAAQTEARYRRESGIRRSEPSVLTEVRHVDREIDKSKTAQKRRDTTAAIENAEAAKAHMDGIEEQTKPVAGSGFRFRDLFQR